MTLPHLEFSLPGWLVELIGSEERVYHSQEERMLFVIELSHLNVRYGTGGPFGAAVFDQHSHRLVAPGVNLVMENNCSMLHAEVVAIMMAQKVLGNYDLGASQLGCYELVSSTEPCAMCLGAIGWSGVRGLVCGARDEDARAVGFDEGVKPAAWVADYRQRGIDIVLDICRPEAVQVLKEYQQGGGTIYNARQGDNCNSRSPV